ncbi:MAG TPA: MOSC domain-containing protein [Acidobacteriaceae bacterium]
MRLLSVNVGLPREVSWHGSSVTTSIFKEPVPGRIALRTLNLDGDRQSDLTVHGGQAKAVYCFPFAHYAYWKAQLPGHPLSPGAFGENFTLESPLEDEIHIGDRFSIGSAELVVTQPRLPCYKLGIRFGSDDMVRRFLASGRTGYYAAVTREGEVGAGDEVTWLNLDPAAVTISDIVRLYIAKEFTGDDTAQVRRALSVDALPASWKTWFEDKLRRFAS